MNGFRWHRCVGLAALAWLLTSCFVPPSSSPQGTRGGLNDVHIEEMGRDGEGRRTIRLTAESNSPLSLFEAQGHLDPYRHCEDGREFQLRWEAPISSLPASTAELEKMWPKGTRFAAVAECEGDLPNEFSAEPASASEKLGHMMGVDGDALASGRAFSLIAPIHYWPDLHGVGGRLKYHAFAEFVGEQTRLAYVRCGGPIQIRNLAVANIPLGGGNPSHPGRGRMLAGIAIECIDAASEHESHP